MIYTDGVHLVADTLAELHDFASRIGLSRHYFEGTRKGHPHYDLFGPTARHSKRIWWESQAVGAGAKRVTSREVLQVSKNCK